MMKIETENATWRSRSTLWLVEPHSRSTAPFWTSGMRFCAVTGTSRIVRAGRLSSALIESSTFSIRSCE